MSGNIHWEPEAIDWLKSHAGWLPKAELCQQFRLACEHHGWATRSDRAACAALIRLGISLMPHRDRYSPEEVARLLCLPVSQARRWASLGLQRPKPQKKLIYSLNEVARFLLTHPWRAKGIPESRIAWALGKGAACQLSKLPKTRPGTSRPVVCAETGEVFSSIAEAARAKYVVPYTLSKAIDNGWLAGGHSWRYWEPPRRGPGRPKKATQECRF